MEQNRFSRQLIVLRAVINGYSGHARLIQSGSSADLELRIQSPAGSAELWAALVEKGENGYRSCPLGQLSVDDRGQATGTFSVSSTNVSPEILAIVQRDDDCKLAMSGFLNGPRNVNWADVRTAACDAVTANACTTGTPASNRLPDRDNDRDNDRDDVRNYRRDNDRDDDRNYRRDNDRDDDRNYRRNNDRDDDRDYRRDYDSDNAAPVFANGSSAAEAAQISPDAIWPEEIASLQQAFETQSPVQAFSGTRYTFVLIPACSDQPEYLAGLWCVHGIPTRAAYAVPADDPDTQPQELEGFLWRSCSSGGGYWVAYIDAATGEPVQNDY